MSGDDQIKGWRDYRKLLPTTQLNDLLRLSDDSGWAATRELLAQMAWTCTEGPTASARMQNLVQRSIPRRFHAALRQFLYKKSFFAQERPTGAAEWPLAPGAGLVRGPRGRLRNRLRAQRT
jgi:hypothetical protein